MVDATILGIEKQEANYNVYNVGSGRRTSVLKVMQSLCRGYGIEAKYQISGNFRLGDIRDNYADLSRISNDLGFEPKVSFDRGIKQFCKWVQVKRFKMTNSQNPLKK